jgi:hypothetical protein
VLVTRVLRRLALLAAGAVLSHDASAQSPDKLECARSFEQGQRLRQAHQLRAAKAELLVCVENCSSVLRQECLSWLGDVEAALPSLIIAARAADGSVLTSVHMLVDGVEVAGGLTQPLELDPGDRDIVLDAPGLARLEQHVFLREGERYRRIDLTLATAPSAAPPPATAATADATGPVSAPPQRGDGAPIVRPVPAIVYALGGLGVVAAAVGTYFQIAGMSQQSGLGTCKPSCPESQIDSARTSLWVGNVTLVVAVASLATAAVLYLTRPPSRRASGGLDVDVGLLGGTF